MAGCKTGSYAPALWKGSTISSMGEQRCVRSLTGTLAYRSGVGNNHQVHSTTGEIPSLCFARPLVLPKPYTSPKDVFRLRQCRMVNGYSRITFYGHEIEVPKAPVLDEVELHLIPDEARQILDIRIWSASRLLQSTTLPPAGIRFHL